GRELKPEGGELLIEDLDLSQRLVGDLLLLVELAGERAGLGLGALGLAALIAEQSGQPRILLVLVDQGRLQGREAVLERLLLGALEREKLGELRQLAVQPRQHGVLAARLRGDEIT